MLKEKDNVLNLINSDHEMMEILRAVRTLELPDWWICAGFVRSKIWDTLHGFTTRTIVPDVDVIYFDQADLNELTEKTIEEKLRYALPDTPWSVKNQARMHSLSHSLPYSSSEDALCKFPETATALGVKIDKKRNLVLLSPYGVNDAISLQVKPTPYFTETKERAAIYEERIAKKNWPSIWPKLNVHHINGGV